MADRMDGRNEDDRDALVRRARAGDEAAFELLVAGHRRELHVHCYRMLGSFEEAEDAVQETLLRAWRARATFDAGSYRAWLYRIATNTCLDELRRSARRVAVGASYDEVSWVRPYPDRLLDELAPAGDEPEAAAVARETIELAFLVALQTLPARQRATVVLRDVLGWTAAETAGALETTEAAANSALQRARSTLRQALPDRRSEWSVNTPTADEREVLARFIAAHERMDTAAAVALMREDIRVTMPPYPWRYDGVGAVRQLVDQAFGPDRPGDWHLLPTAVNRMPAAATYLRAPGESAYRPLKLDVLRVVDRRVAEVTTFGPELFPDLGLPELVRRPAPTA